MSARARAFGVMAGGALSATLGFLWYESDPMAGLSVAVSGAAVLGWGAHRLVFLDR